MIELPKSLSISQLLSNRAPDDMLVSEVLDAIAKGTALDPIRQRSRHPDRVRIRVLDNDGAPVADDMTMGTMRRFLAEGKVHICIDDEDGGELVS